MSYIRSDSTERLPQEDIFPSLTATRISVIRNSPSTGTACYWQLQQSPIIASLPPALPMPWIHWFLDNLWAQPNYVPTFFTDGSFLERPTLETIFHPQLIPREAHASVIVLDSSPHWRRRPIIALRIRDIQEIGRLSSYTPELLALTLAIWIRTASHEPVSLYTDSESSLDTIANRRQYLKSAKTSCHILLRRIDECLEISPTPLYHVSSHADDHKSLEDISFPEWGNFIADNVAGDFYSDLEELGLQVISLDIFARNLLPDIPCFNSWYWGDASGTPLPLVPLSSQLNDPLDESRENAQRHTEGNKLYLQATRDIKAHEQIFVHYGVHYWADGSYNLPLMIKVVERYINKIDLAHPTWYHLRLAPLLWYYLDGPTAPFPPNPSPVGTADGPVLLVSPLPNLLRQRSLQLLITAMGNEGSLPMGEDLPSTSSIASFC